jgi:hypothetical protein
MNLIILLVFLIISVVVLIWIVSLLIGDLSAATYVPTPTKDLNIALAELQMKPGKKFVDLGSGDGKIVMAAAKDYKVLAVGYEINPLLVLYSKIAAKTGKVAGAVFRGRSFWDANLGEFDYMYCYLYPPAMRRLAPKLEKELKSGTMVVSKAFEMKSWKNKLVKKVDMNGKILWVYRV